MDVKPFDPNSGCVKCNARQTRFEYQGQTHEMRSNGGTGQPVYSGDDVIEVTCGRCGYHWKMQPIDAKRPIKTDANFAILDPDDLNMQDQAIGSVINLLDRSKLLSLAIDAEYADAHDLDARAVFSKATGKVTLTVEMQTVPERKRHLQP